MNQVWEQTAKQGASSRGDLPQDAPPQQPKEEEGCGVDDCHNSQDRIQRCMYSSMEEICTAKACSCTLLS